jgi:hypothetical protein
VVRDLPAFLRVLPEPSGLRPTLPGGLVQSIAQKPQLGCDEPVIQGLVSDVTGVQAARDCRVSSPFDDGPAVRK